MEPFKENHIVRGLSFPVDIFIRDNLENNIEAEPHWHECLEILFILQGTAGQQVNDKHFRVGKHDLIILNEGDIHSTYCTPLENTRILVIKFMPEFIQSNLSYVFEAKYMYMFMKSRSNQVCHLADILKNSTHIYDLMVGLYKEYERKQPGFEMYIKGYLYQLIACLVRNGVIQEYSISDYERDFARIDKVLKYVEIHYNEKIDLPLAASMLNLSNSYFSRYFKRITGRSFKEYVDFVRICEAEKLILSSNMSISQVAYEAGFSNISSFNRVFRRIRGFAPGNIKRAKTANK